jgi:hypothetical protein
MAIGAKKFCGYGMVQCGRRDLETGKARIGSRTVSLNKGFSLRIAALFLLCVALLNQVSFARSRDTQESESCTMSLARMKSILSSWLGELGQWTQVTSSEKAFIHILHQRMSCEEYTRLYENSNSHTNEKERAAASRWHWNQYHSEDEATRAAAVSSVNLAVLAGNE